MSTGSVSTPTGVFAAAVQRIEPFMRQCDFSIWEKKFELFVKLTKIDSISKPDVLLGNLDIHIFETVINSGTDLSDYTKLVAFLNKRYSTQDNFLNRIEFFNVSFSGSFDDHAAN